MRITYGCCSDRGDVRTENQDRVLALSGEVEGKEAGLFVLADGMGGLEYGSSVSTYITDEFLKWWEEDFPQMAHAGKCEKEEIRELSKDMNLPTWNKPSFACLASRFVYGETITEEKLHMVDQAEQFLMDLGFHQFRVRIHGTMARIEVPEEEILKIADNETRTKITEKFRTLGFSYVTLDLQGFRSGSMNETLGK